MSHIREEVKWFAEQMELKLQANDHKGGWEECNLSWLYQRLREKSDELIDKMTDYYLMDKGTYEDIISKTADVANYAMMIGDIVRKQEEKR